MLIMAGCQKEVPPSQRETEVKLEGTPQAWSNDFDILMPQLNEDKFYGNEYVQLDTSNSGDGYFYISLRQPRDTDKVAYPEIFCKDNWFGDKALGFEIATTGYGDHSIAQAQRAVAGLQIAIDLVEALLTTAELYGLKIRR